MFLSRWSKQSSRAYGLFYRQPPACYSSSYSKWSSSAECKPSSWIPFVCLGMSASLAHPENTPNLAQFKIVKIIATLQGQRGPPITGIRKVMQSVMFKWGPHVLDRGPFTPKFLSTFFFQKIVGGCQTSGPWWFAAACQSGEGRWGGLLLPIRSPAATALVETSKAWSLPIKLFCLWQHEVVVPGRLREQAYSPGKNN